MKFYLLRRLNPIEGATNLMIVRAPGNKSARRKASDLDKFNGHGNSADWMTAEGSSTACLPINGGSRVLVSLEDANANLHF